MPHFGGNYSTERNGAPDIDATEHDNTSNGDSLPVIPDAKPYPFIDINPSDSYDLYVVARCEHGYYDSHRVTVSQFQSRWCPGSTRSDRIRSVWSDSVAPPADGPRIELDALGDSKIVAP